MSRFNFPIILLLVLSFSNHSQAQWVCEYTASKMESEKVILTCGVGESEKLSKARIKARKNAMEEFQSLCSFSTQCQDYDFSVEPLRTDCKKLENENYRCHRALRIRISDKKKSDISINYKQSQIELKKKQKEIDSLKKQIQTLKTLYYAEKDKKIKQELLKKMEKRLLNVEGKKIELQEKINKKELKKGLYTYVYPKNSINFNAVLKSVKLIKPNLPPEASKDLRSSLVLLELSYERSVWKYLSIEFSGFFAKDLKGNENSYYRNNPYNTPTNSYEISSRYAKPRSSYKLPPPSYASSRSHKMPLPPLSKSSSLDSPSYEISPTVNEEETSYTSKFSISNFQGLGFATRSRFYLPTYSNLYFSLSYELLQSTIELEETKKTEKEFKYFSGTTSSTTKKKEKIQANSSFLGIGLGWTHAPRMTRQVLPIRIELGYSWAISTDIDLKSLTEPSSYSISGGPYFLFSIGIPFSFPATNYSH